MNSTNKFLNYNSWMKESFNVRLDKREYEMFSNYFNKNYSKLLPVNKDVEILEIAPGMGQFLYFLNKKGYKNISAVDLDSNNIKQCHSMGFEFAQVGDLYDYIPSLKDNSIDCVVMNDIIEHIPSDWALEVLRLLHSKLKNGGSILIKTVNCNNVYGLSSYFSDYTHVNGFTSEKIRHAAMLSGFKEVQVKNLYLYPNIIFLDTLFKIFFAITYKWKSFFFLFNGRKSDNVFSKNLLAKIVK